MVAMANHRYYDDYSQKILEFFDACKDNEDDDTDESTLSEELTARSSGGNGEGTPLSSSLNRKDMKGIISKKRAGQQPTTQIQPESEPQSEKNQDEVKDTEVAVGYRRGERSRGGRRSFRLLRSGRKANRRNSAGQTRRKRRRRRRKPSPLDSRGLPPPGRERFRAPRAACRAGPSWQLGMHSYFFCTES